MATRTKKTSFSTRTGLTPEVQTAAIAAIQKAYDATFDDDGLPVRLLLDLHGANFTITSREGLATLYYRVTSKIIVAKGIRKDTTPQKRYTATTEHKPSASPSASIGAFDLAMKLYGTAEAAYKALSFQMAIDAESAESQYEVWSAIERLKKLACPEFVESVETEINARHELRREIDAGELEAKKAAIEPEIELPGFEGIKLNVHVGDDARVWIVEPRTGKPMNAQKFKTVKAAIAAVLKRLTKHGIQNAEQLNQLIEKQSTFGGLEEKAEAVQVEPETEKVVQLKKRGDFYEATGDNAAIIAEVLGITLTMRDGSAMAAIPYHRLSEYAALLADAGLKVECEGLTIESAPEAPETSKAAECKHPANRLHAWMAHDGVMCVACCDCGQPLAFQKMRPERRMAWPSPAMPPPHVAGIQCAEIQK